MPFWEVWNRPSPAPFWGEKEVRNRRWRMAKTNLPMLIRASSFLKCRLERSFQPRSPPDTRVSWSTQISLSPLSHCNVMTCALVRPHVKPELNWKLYLSNGDAGQVSGLYLGCLIPPFYLAAVSCLRDQMSERSDQNRLVARQ